MAEAPVQFDQAKFFQQNDPLLNAVLTNVGTFAGDVSSNLGTLIEFLNVTKIYLQALADPIALVLIPAINQLIEAIEDLKNIGFGTLGVWPWEAGKLESGIDSSKALDAIQALIVALNDINPDKLKWDPGTNQFKSVTVLGDTEQLQQEGADFLNSQPFGFTSFEKVSIETDDDGNTVEIKSLDRSWINNTLNTIYNYLNPKEWEEGDNSAKRVIDSLNESFKIRTLTPAQLVSEINSSFDDVNDSARPVGSGNYVAFVGFFALPTHHALRDMINSLLKFFSNFLKNIPDLSDDKVLDIELGQPLVISGLEQQLKVVTGEREKEINEKIIEASSELSDARSEEFSAGVDITYGTGQESTRLREIIERARNESSKYAEQIQDYNFQISDLINRKISSPDKITIDQEIARISALKTTASQSLRRETITIQEYGRMYANEISKENNLNENYNAKVEQVKQLEAQKNNLLQQKNNISLDSTVLQEKFYSLDNTSNRDLSKLKGEKTYRFNKTKNTHNGITIPMFKEGDIIQQGHVFNDFTAEVVDHPEILVKDGQVISNKLRVRKVRGNIKPNTSSPLQQINVPPIIALDGKQLDSFGILKTGTGIQGAKDSLNFPMFAPANPDVPQLEPSLKFKATIESDNNILRTVLPLNDEIIKYNNQGSISDDPISIINAYTDVELINKVSFQVLMENFVETLSIGAPLSHNFFTTSSGSETDIPLDPFDRLAWSVWPGLGLTPCIKSVKIGGQEIKKQDIKTQLFVQVKKDDSSKDIEYSSMKEITIEIGIMSKTGDIEPYKASFIKVPNKIATNPFLDVPITMYKSSGSRSSLPNWKFTRIQDIFPIYGKVIDRIVDKLEYAKDLASGSLDDLNKWIQYFEDLVRDLKQLNTEIQQLLQFLSSGLDKQGLYSASFSGDDGVNGFKRKLNNAKIKNVNLEPVKEFSLEPVSVTREIQNPISGQSEFVTTEVLKMIAKTNPESVGEQLLDWSDLDSLKYSGGFVFYAQGNDTKLLDKFLTTTGLVKVEEKENPQPKVDTEIDFSNVNSLLENIRPEVEKIEVEQTGFLNNNVFVSSEGRENVRKNTQIKITFKNNNNILTEDDKKLIREAKGNEFIFDVDIQYGSVQTAQTDDSTLGNVVLSKDNFETATPLNYSVQPVKETISIGDDEIDVVKSIIIRPQNNLEALTKYKIKINKTILNTNNQTPKESFETTIGFTTAATSIVDIGLE